MIDEKSWKEFRESGLLWFINTTLHVFGWAICIELDDNKEVTRAYPARVKFRGFEADANDDGYLKVSEYLNKESSTLLEEIKE